MEPRRGPEKWFTGGVWMDAAPADSSPGAGVFRVLFEPGARTNWHTHPEGQILYVVPGEKHWHGAAPQYFMVHVAVNPAASSGGGTEWLEPVTDEEYLGKTYRRP